MRIKLHLPKQFSNTTAKLIRTYSKQSPSSLADFSLQTCKNHGRVRICLQTLAKSQFPELHLHIDVVVVAIHNWSHTRLKVVKSSAITPLIKIDTIGSSILQSMERKHLKLPWYSNTLARIPPRRQIIHPPELNGIDSNSSRRGGAVRLNDMAWLGLHIRPEVGGNKSAVKTSFQWW